MEGGGFRLGSEKPMGDKGDRDREQQDAEKEDAPRFRVDEGWKRSVAEERERLRREQKQSRQKAEGAGARQPAKPDVRIFFAGLYTQTLMCLGEIENPLTKRKEQNLPEAQYLIDTIDMLKQKTKGNLSSDEEQYLDGLLHDLRMRYVDAVNRPAAEAREGEKKDTDNK